MNQSERMFRLKRLQFEFLLAMHAAVFWEQAVEETRRTTPKAHELIRKRKKRAKASRADMAYWEKKIKEMVPAWKRPEKEEGYPR